MEKSLHTSLKRSVSEGKKHFAVLVDPDKYDDNGLLDLAEICNLSGVSYLFVGGSLMTTERFEHTIKVLKKTTEIPVIIFPGSNIQVSEHADGILFLSLISGRNSEFLIGQHVVAAPYVAKAGIEALSTGYMLVEGSNNTTANYMSNTLPIPYEKDEIAVATAMAGEMLGMNLIYMDGGSGSGRCISTSMIQSVKNSISIPLIVGGGITDPRNAQELWQAGADIIVVGNAIEKDISLVTRISEQLPSII